MALDVYIQEVSRSVFRCKGDKYVLSFNDEEGYYWFIYPLLQELERKTGYFIDLYGYAVFGGDDLDSLQRTLVHVRLITEAKPEEWEVITAIQTHPEYQELRHTISKVQMRELLDKLEAAINDAHHTNQYVAFRGD